MFATIIFMVYKFSSEAQLVFSYINNLIMFEFYY
jgi:hypothetical protein